MNKNVRHLCIEVLLNEAEVSRLDGVRGGLGRSPYFRDLLHRATRANGKPPVPPKESRACRGGKTASRASAGMRRLI